MIREPTPATFGLNALTSQSTCGVTQLCSSAGCSMLAYQGAGPEIVDSPLGSADSFLLEKTDNNYQIHVNSPIHIILRSDNYFSGTGLDLNQIESAISLAAQTWNYYANTDLFYYNVTADPSAVIGSGKCIIQFSPGISGSALGLTYIYLDGSGRVTQSNMLLASAQAWTTDYGNASTTERIDLQSVVFHELGHVTGLGDLYNLNDSRGADHNEVMNIYWMGHPRHSPGAGDRTGEQGIYGCGTAVTTTTVLPTTTTTPPTTSTTTTSTTLQGTTTTSTTSSTSMTTTTTSSSTAPTTTSSPPTSTTIPATTTTTATSTTTLPGTTTTTTSSVTTTTNGQCQLKGDYPPCGAITVQEILSTITEWSNGNASLMDVFNLIVEWASSP